MTDSVEGVFIKKFVKKSAGIWFTRNSAINWNLTNWFTC